MLRAKRVERERARTPVKLRLPCELIGEHFLPFIRAQLAKELVGGHGMSQLQAARVLDVTQPAVYNYLRSNPSPKEEELGEALEDIDRMVKGLADDIIESRVTQEEAMARVCSLCIQLRTGGPICRIHERLIPALTSGRCSMCLQDLAEQKRRSLEDYHILSNVREAVRLIENTWELSLLIPEIGMNIAMARPDAPTVQEVVGIPARIHPVGGRPHAANPPEFGGSSHVANAVLSMMRFTPSLRSAVSLKFDPLVVEVCEKLGFTVSFFDRADEPEDVRKVDGKTIPWGIQQAVGKAGRPPDIVYDLGGVGKEPMVFLFGTNALDVAYSAVRIAREYLKRKAKI